MLCCAVFRFWGTPIPIWASEDLEEVRVIGSIAELEQVAGRKVGSGTGWDRGDCACGRECLCLCVLGTAGWGAMFACVTRGGGFARLCTVPCTHATFVWGGQGCTVVSCSDILGVSMCTDYGVCC